MAASRSICLLLKLFVLYICIHKTYIYIFVLCPNERVDSKLIAGSGIFKTVKPTIRAHPHFLPVLMCTAAYLLGAVRVYPDGHSDMHSPPWMMKLSKSGRCTLEQSSALMQRQPSNL